MLPARNDATVHPGQASPAVVHAAFCATVGGRYQAQRKPHLLRGGGTRYKTMPRSRAPSTALRQVSSAQTGGVVVECAAQILRTSKRAQSATSPVHYAQVSAQ